MKAIRFPCMTLVDAYKNTNTEDSASFGDMLQNTVVFMYCRCAINRELFFLGRTSVCSIKL